MASHFDLRNVHPFPQLPLQVEKVHVAQVIASVVLAAVNQEVTTGYHGVRHQFAAGNYLTRGQNIVPI